MAVEVPRTAIGDGYHANVGNGSTLDDGVAIEQAAADGRLNRLVVRNPAGPDTPYISLLFPR